MLLFSFFSHFDVTELLNGHMHQYSESASCSSMLSTSFVEAWVQGPYINGLLHPSFKPSGFCCHDFGVLPFHVSEKAIIEGN